MTRAEMATKLKAMIEEQKHVTIPSLDAHLDLDSFTMMMVITFINSEIGVRLDLDKMDFDAFMSIDTLLDLIQASMSHSQSSALIDAPPEP